MERHVEGICPPVTSLKIIAETGKRGSATMLADAILPAEAQRLKTYAVE